MGQETKKAETLVDVGTKRRTGSHSVVLGVQGYTFPTRREGVDEDVIRECLGSLPLTTKV